MKKQSFCYLLLGIAALISISSYAREKNKKSHTEQVSYYEPEEQKDRTVLGTTLGFGAAGAIAAGAAGSAKWTPLGLGAGLLGGYLIGKGIRHHREKKEERRASKKVAREHKKARSKKAHKKSYKATRSKKNGYRK